MQRGVSWWAVSGLGCALRKCAIEPGVVGKEYVGLVTVIMSDGVADVVETDVGIGGSTAIDTSCSSL